MPPKGEKKSSGVPPSTCITRSRHVSSGTLPLEPVEEEPRSISRASSDPSLVAASSPGTSVWSIQDHEFSDEELSEQDFVNRIDITSTHHTLPLPDPTTLPPLVERSYSPTEFDLPEHDNTQAFTTAIEMSQNEEPNPPAGGQGTRAIDPLAMMALMIKQMQDDRKEDIRQRKAELKVMQDAQALREMQYADQRHDDIERDKNNRKANEDALKALAAEVQRLAVHKPESARPSHLKLPSFDLEKDRESFKQWKDRWTMHIRAHRIHLIEDDDERKERALTELTAALSNNTLQWIANRDFSDEDRADPEVLIQAFEAYIKESTNPTVTVVELFTMKRQPHESADRLNARINEKLNKVDFDVITDIRDYFGMTATIIASNPQLRKQMYLDKVDTYAKAHAAVKADEQASTHAQMVTNAASSNEITSDINFVSSYKKNRNNSNQASHAQSGGSYNHSDRGSNPSRGNTRGGYPRGRGGTNHGSSRPSSPDRSSRDRGRSESRQPAGHRQASPWPQSDQCPGCGKPGHLRKDCWAKELD